MSGANLSRILNATLSLARTIIVPNGELIVWKKCRNEIIVKLRIPSEAKRSNAHTRKCRAEFAEVLETSNGLSAVSLHDNYFIYTVGETVRCLTWEENRHIECGGGIHFYLTEDEAKAHY